VQQAARDLSPLARGTVRLTGRDCARGGAAGRSLKRRCHFRLKGGTQAKVSQ